MSEQGEKTCASLCEKVAGLPDKAREALLNIAEGIYIGMEIGAENEPKREEDPHVCRRLCLFSGDLSVFGGKRAYGKHTERVLSA